MTVHPWLAVLAALVLLELLALLLCWAVARWYLGGPDLSALDRPCGEHFEAAPPHPQGEHEAVVARLAELRRRVRSVPLRRRLAVGRQLLDEALPCDDLAVSFTPVDAGGVPAEWVQAPAADGSRRTLYIHGGGFAVGSARSHRRLTARFAQLTGGVVLAIDYRLMPEHPRRAGIEDCRRAYAWMLQHAPAPEPTRGAPTKVWVAGDSAGGNLTLSLIAWVRDSGLRPPDGAVAFSPATDATLASPSLRAHVRTDPMLGPLLGRLVRLPRSVLLWGAWVVNRMHPRDPALSPLWGDLSRLPPVLVQASRAEMLHDDARRYVNRAVAAGSPVRLQTWERMVHVWQIFHPDLKEGRDALEEVGRFLNGR